MLTQARSLLANPRFNWYSAPAGTSGVRATVAASTAVGLTAGADCCELGVEFGDLPELGTWIE